MRTALRESIRNVGIPAVAAGALAVAFPSLPLIGGVLLLASLIAFAAWPMLGWSLVVLTYPFIYLQVFFGETMNIPYVDLLALLTFVGVAIRVVVNRVRRRSAYGLRLTAYDLPGLLPFLLFIAVAALSLINVEDVAAGVKFLLRPLTFSYLMFVALPVIVIDSPRRLFTTFRIMFLVGVLAAAMGVWSLLSPPEPGAFRRAVPIIVYGMTPLGTNHNLLAEVLVSVVPVGVILALFTGERLRRWYVVGTLALTAVALLTFSRNGWLTLAVEGAVLSVALARDRGIPWRRIAAATAPIAAVVAVAISLFSFTAVARSSNVNRLRLTEIAFAQFREHPIIGAGIGTFQEAVARDKWYIADFGKPQEAHGLIQKTLAETGVLGFLAFAALLAAVVAAIIRTYRSATVAPAWRFILLALLCTAFGSIVFQIFNTSYFVSKLWLPLGVAVAAVRLAVQGIALRRADTGFQ